MMIVDASTLLEIVQTDPAERLVCTYGEGDAAAWHLVIRRHAVSTTLVNDLLQPTTGPERPQLVPVGDGLLPGTSQTYQFSVTSPKLPDPNAASKRKRGRPRNPNALDAAERKARSRDKQGREDIYRRLLIAVMADTIPAGKLRQLEAHRTFGPLIREARTLAKAAALAITDLDG